MLWRAQTPPFSRDRRTLGTLCTTSPRANVHVAEVSRARRALWAACHPHIPWTPGPGGVDAEHRNNLGLGVRYGARVNEGRKRSCAPSTATAETSPPE